MGKSYLPLIVISVSYTHLDVYKRQEQDPDDESKSSTMSMEMEAFYAQAKDADYIIYNLSLIHISIELSREEQIQLLQDFIKEQFVADGMCADTAIHDPYPPEHNPHAHILLTVRPLDEKGKWPVSYTHLLADF